MRKKKKCNNKVNPLTTRESEFSESGVHPMYYPVFRNTFKNDEFRYYFKKKIIFPCIYELFVET